MIDKIQFGQRSKSVRAKKRQHCLSRYKIGIWSEYDCIEFMEGEKKWCIISWNVPCLSDDCSKENEHLKSSEKNKVKNLGKPQAWFKVSELWIWFVMINFLFYHHECKRHFTMGSTAKKIFPQVYGKYQKTTKKKEKIFNDKKS